MDGSVLFRRLFPVHAFAVPVTALHAPRRHIDRLTVQPIGRHIRHPGRADIPGKIPGTNHALLELGRHAVLELFHLGRLQGALGQPRAVYFAVECVTEFALARTGTARGKHERSPIGAYLFDLDFFPNAGRVRDRGIIDLGLLIQRDPLRFRVITGRHKIPLPGEERCVRAHDGDRAFSVAQLKRERAGLQHQGKTGFPSALPF